VTRPERGEHGTSTLEVAGMAPLVVFVLMVLIQTAVSLYAITTAQTAARQGARAMSKGDSPSAVVDASIPDWMDVTTTTFGPGSGVRVQIDFPDIVPGMNLKISRRAVMPGDSP
jgi:hypothetical protein